MYQSTAVIPTDRASRYRDQLASHGAAMSAMHASRASDGHAPPVLDASTSEGSVVLRLAAGSCTIIATSEALHVRAEAETLESLAKIQNGITNRITKIGRRDNLTVAWTEPDAVAGDAQVEGAAPRHLTPLLMGLGVLAVLAMIAIHVGLITEMSHHHWTWWATGVVAALLVVKVALARHFGFGHRRGTP